MYYHLRFVSGYGETCPWGAQQICCCYWTESFGLKWNDLQLFHILLIHLQQRQSTDPNQEAACSWLNCPASSPPQLSLKYLSRRWGPHRPLYFLSDFTFRMSCWFIALLNFTTTASFLNCWYLRWECVMFSFSTLESLKYFHSCLTMTSLPAREQFLCSFCSSLVWICAGKSVVDSARGQSSYYAHWQVHSHAYYGRILRRLFA